VVNSLCTTNTQVSHAENRAARHFRESDIRAPWHRSEDNRNTSAMPPVATGTALPLPLERYRSVSPQSIDCYSEPGSLTWGSCALRCAGPTHSTLWPY
jgi:hypothetical protein